MGAPDPGNRKRESAFWLGIYGGMEYTGGFNRLFFRLLLPHSALGGRGARAEAASTLVTAPTLNEKRRWT